MIFDSFYDAEFFSRKDIMEVCGIQVSSAGEVLSKLKETRVIEPVVGHGKGKYRFIIQKSLLLLASTTSTRSLFYYSKSSQNIYKILPILSSRAS